MFHSHYSHPCSSFAGPSRHSHHHLSPVAASPCACSHVHPSHQPHHPHATFAPARADFATHPAKVDYAAAPYAHPSHYSHSSPYDLDSCSSSYDRDAAELAALRARQEERHRAGAALAREAERRRYEEELLREAERIRRERVQAELVARRKAEAVRQAELERELVKQAAFARAVEEHERRQREQEVQRQRERHRQAQIEAHIKQQIVAQVVAQQVTAQRQAQAAAHAAAQHKAQLQARVAEQRRRLAEKQRAKQQQAASSPSAPLEAILPVVQFVLDLVHDESEAPSPFTDKPTTPAAPKSAPTPAPAAEPTPAPASSTATAPSEDDELAARVKHRTTALATLTALTDAFHSRCDAFARGTESNHLGYQEFLNRHLAKIDEVTSAGDRVVKDKRKELVKAVNAELDRVEGGQAEVVAEEAAAEPVAAVEFEVAAAPAEVKSIEESSQLTTEVETVQDLVEVATTPAAEPEDESAAAVESTTEPNTIDELAAAPAAEAAPVATEPAASEPVTVQPATSPAAVSPAEAASAEPATADNATTHKSYAAAVSTPAPPSVPAAPAAAAGPDPTPTPSVLEVADHSHDEPASDDDDDTRSIASHSTASDHELTEAINRIEREARELGERVAQEEEAERAAAKGEGKASEESDEELDGYLVV